MQGLPDFQAVQEYWLDAWQRSILTLDVLRQRGNAFLEQSAKEVQHVLTFQAELVIDGRIFALGALAAQETRTVPVSRREGTSLQGFVSNYGGNFQNAVSSRQQALGSTASGQIADKANSSVAVSFISQLGRAQAYQNNFMAPAGVDLSPVVDHGGAVLLAWAENYSPIKRIEQFTPRRSQRDTLWRFALKVE